MDRMLLAAALALALFAGSASAQQEGGAGQERTSQPSAGQQGMTQDTSMAGGERMEPGMRDTSMAGEMDEMEDMEEMEEGEAMPTTASPLPLVLAIGSVLVAVGLGLRYARRN